MFGQTMEDCWWMVLSGVVEVWGVFEDCCGRLHRLIHAAVRQVVGF
jgi:hypothetical protein